jgi:arginine-tRNA-protein transferase
MNSRLPPIIMESFRARSVEPDWMDELWSRGWRHFGDEFFRYSIVEQSAHWETVLPLRIDLARFTLSKSQRRNLRKNQDLTVSVQSAALSDEAEAMFHRHKTRFRENVPDTLESFLGREPGEVPCVCFELRCHLHGELIALSYFDLGQRGISSVYGMFEPAFSARGLGIFTLLQEIEWARLAGKRYVYPGYATIGPSHYDYKKQFHGLEAFDWAGETWRDWDRGGSGA